jgi:NAD(P)-dependent dehydrogenase (short-subunit alcohol dehydrogenase family)
LAIVRPLGPTHGNTTFCSLTPRSKAVTELFGRWLFSGWVSRKPMAGTSTLASIDAAIEALGRTLALEIAPRRANVVMPGAIDTPLWGARLTPEQQREHFARIGQSLPVGRAGTALDVAHAVRFLLENGFTTGAVVDVDGGQR